jgi:hypothetical protein
MNYVEHAYLCEVAHSMYAAKIGVSLSSRIDYQAQDESMFFVEAGG